MISRSYRTVSLATFQILTRSPPWDLVIQSRSIQYLLKHKRPITNWSIFPKLQSFLQDTTGVFRERQIYQKYTSVINATWQEHWHATLVNPWTHQLCPTPAYFIQAQVVLDFWTSQALSGHGVFKEFIRRIGRSPTCTRPYSDGVTQSARHVFQECPITAPYIALPNSHKPESSREWLKNDRRTVKVLWVTENLLACRILNHKGPTASTRVSEW